MGGRRERDQRPDREAWITEVSSVRLERYSALMESGGAVQRVDGSARLHGQQSYFRSLVRGEIARRRKS